MWVLQAMRCDNGTEFKNAHIIKLYGSKGIKREYSNARTPQQNRVAERNNKTLIEAAKTMLADSKLPTMFWTEAVRTACYVLNRLLVTSPHNKTPYALLTGNIPSVSHFKPFGCHVTILNTSNHLGKFDGKADEGYIVGYSARTQEATTNPVGTQDVDSDSDCDEQVIIVPSYPSHSIQGTKPKDTSGDEKRASAKTVPPGSIPVPTGSIPVLSSDTMVSTDAVPVHTSSPTDLFFDDEPTTRFPSPTDLGNHDPSPGIFSFSSYDDEFGAALNHVAFTLEENPFLDAKDEGVFYIGCSRSMTGNKERLDDFQVFHGRKVTFGGGEGMITGKETIRTPTLDFENVYYVKELQQFNLCFISQICDKKNRILFTDTECLVLSKDFTLPDESIVVLWVPRKHNLYTINLNNLCPRGNLACLVATASVDESVKWHRRMGHVNYKNMNKLVKGNLVCSTVA
nr:ribonuclease H-like domain-containing protein [Tanacetum cinerariifolium]